MVLPHTTVIKQAHHLQQPKGTSHLHPQHHSNIKLQRLKLSLKLAEYSLSLGFRGEHPISWHHERCNSFISRTSSGVHCLKSWRRFPEHFVADYMMNSLPQSIRNTGKLLTSSWLSFLIGSEPITVWVGRNPQKFSQCKRFAQLNHILTHELSLLKARKIRLKYTSIWI